jgi:uncharacterized protein
MNDKLAFYLAGMLAIFSVMQGSERVAIIGVTGFIGKGLPALLAQEGLVITGVSRSGIGTITGVDRWQKPDALDLTDHRIVINLAGESIDRRWTPANRELFHKSRIGVTQRVVEAIARLPEKSRPRLLVNASAVGIYGDRGDDLLDEMASPGEGYLAELCAEWEAAAHEAEALGVRVVTPRIGIVLGKGGAAFQKLVRVFKLGIGGRLGSGRQWMPWIHLDDLRAALVHSVTSGNLSGPINCTAPAPERNADFTRKLAAALHRPALLPVPGFALKIALGGFGGALLAGQNARPAALLTDGFHFRHPTLDAALIDLLAEN